VDTGGLDFEAQGDVIQAGIHRQARAALGEADLLLFVVDAKAGALPTDSEVANVARRLGLPVVVAANKVDSPKRSEWKNEFYALGLGDVYPISAAHGRGIDDLLDGVWEKMPIPKHPPLVAEEDPAPSTHSARGHHSTREEGGALRLALVGKPNAGKSSLLNRLVGAERSLVHSEPGTTTDPVDTEITFGGKEYVVVDTAGIRRKARIDEDVEKLSVVLALNQIKRASVIVLVIDADVGPSEQDARLAGEIQKAGRGMVVALNKADLLGPMEGAKVKEKLADELHFLKHVPFQMISAQRGDGVGELMEAVDKVHREYQKRVPTAALNVFFAEVLEAHPPPTFRGRNVTIQYLTQPQACPPTFLLFANRANALAPSYKRYVENQLRKHYGFRGTPIKVVAKSKNEGKPKRQRALRKGRPKRLRG